MTAEHLSKTQLVRYGARTLNSEELLAVDRHLASCDACHGKLTSMSPNVSSRVYDLSIEEPFHLDYDQHLAPYVDGAANEIDREIIESHIALCSQCEEDLRDLQEFKQQTVPTSLPIDRDLSTSRWTGWMQWPQPLNPQMTAALLIAIFVLGITAAVLVWTQNRTQLRDKQAGAASPPGVDPSPSPDQLVTQPSPDLRHNQLELPRSQSGEPLIAFNDGGQRVTLDERGNSNGLESLPPDLRRTVENVLADRKCNQSPALSNLSKHTGTLRGQLEEQDTIEFLSPAGVVIESDRPTFHWRALEGASEYVVTVHDSNFRPIESSGPLSGTEWSIQNPLPRGATYSWQIRAVVNGKTVISPKPPASEVRFRVLDQKTFAAIENARRVQGNSHLAMGVLYWKHGLMDAAEREFEALERANPGSTVAKELLRSLRSLRSP
jgi:hypothetical protein